MQIAKSNIPASVDKLDHVSINALAPKRKVCHGSVPSPVTVVKHLADLVGGFLVRHTLVPEDKHNVTVFALDEIFAVRAKVVLPAGS